MWNVYEIKKLPQKILEELIGKDRQKYFLIWKRSIKIKNQKVLIYSIKFLSLDMYVGSIPPLL